MTISNNYHSSKSWKSNINQTIIIASLKFEDAIWLLYLVYSERYHSPSTIWDDGVWTQPRYKEATGAKANHHPTKFLQIYLTGKEDWPRHQAPTIKIDMKIIMNFISCRKNFALFDFCLFYYLIFSLNKILFKVKIWMVKVVIDLRFQSTILYIIIIFSIIWIPHQILLFC